MNIPTGKFIFRVSFSVFFLATIHDAEAFDNGDALSIASKSVLVDQKIDPTSAFAGGVATWGKRAASVIDVNKEFQKMTDFKSVIAGSSAVAAGQAYDKIVDSRLPALVKPACKIILLGRAGCMAVNLSAHGAAFMAGDSLKETVRSFADDSYDSVSRDINAAASSLNSAVDTVKNLPLPKLNPHMSDDKGGTKQIGGIQTEKKDCISTNLNPALDDCFKDERENVEEEAQETASAQQMWKSKTVSSSESFENLDDDSCFSAPKKLRAFAQQMAAEYHQDGCSIQMMSENGSFSYECPPNSGQGKGTVDFVQRDESIVMKQILFLYAANGAFEATTLFEKCNVRP